MGITWIFSEGGEILRPAVKAFHINNLLIFIHSVFLGQRRSSYTFSNSKLMFVAEKYNFLS